MYFITTFNISFRSGLHLPSGWKELWRFSIVTLSFGSSVVHWGWFYKLHFLDFNIHSSMSSYLGSIIFIKSLKPKGGKRCASSASKMPNGGNGQVVCVPHWCPWDDKIHETLKDFNQERTVLSVISWHNEWAKRLKRITPWQSWQSSFGQQTCQVWFQTLWYKGCVYSSKQLDRTYFGSNCLVHRVFIPRDIKFRLYKVLATFCSSLPMTYF